MLTAGGEHVIDDAPQPTPAGHRHVVGLRETFRRQVTVAKRVPGAEGGHHLVGGDDVGGKLGT